MNPSIVEHDHQRQVFWQITLPIAVGGVIVLALLVLAILSTFSSGSTAVGDWRDISLIFMILPTLLVGFIFVALFAGLIYLNTRLLKGTPRLAHKMQNFMVSLSQLVKKWADRSVSPVMSVQGRWAGIQAFWRRIF